MACYRVIFTFTFTFTFTCMMCIKISIEKFRACYKILFLSNITCKYAKQLNVFLTVHHELTVC